MLNISSALADYLRDRRYCRWTLDITFEDGTHEAVTDNDLTIDGCRIVSGAGTSGLSVGNVISRYIEIAIYNDDYKYDQKVFAGAKIDLHCTYDLDDGAETLEIGEFFVTQPASYGSIVDIVARDKMYLADAACNIVLNGKTLGTIYRECCTAIGLTAGTDSFVGDDYIVNGLPEVNLTYRQVFSYIAMIAGGNVYLSGDDVLIKTFSTIEASASVPGSVTFRTDAGDIASETMRQTVSTDDVEVTGIGIDVDDGEETATYISGTDRYLLKVENPFALGNPQAAVDLIAESLEGLRFRPFESEIQCFPVVEVGDPCIVTDGRGSSYSSFVTDCEVNFVGHTVIKCQAETSAENDARAGGTVYEVIAEIVTRRILAQFAKIDLANIDKAYMNQWISHFGLADVLAVTDEATIVSLTADMIKAGQIIADRLALKGTDGLYYAINADHMTAEQMTDEKYQQAIDGSALVAKSVTANSIAAKTITATEVNMESLQTSIAYIGKRDGTGYYLELTGTGVKVKDGDDVLAEFGEETNIGDVDGHHVTIVPGLFAIADGNMVKLMLRDDDLYVTGELEVQGDAEFYEKLVSRKTVYGIGRVIAGEKTGESDGREGCILNGSGHIFVRGQNAAYIALARGTGTGTDLAAGTGSIVVDSNNDLVIHSTSRYVRVDPVGNYFTPARNGVINLGSSANRWNVVYSSAALNTSDEREKDIIGDIPEEYEKAFLEMQPIAFRWKGSDDERVHLGFGAQRTEKILSKHGIETEDAGIVNYENDVYMMNYSEALMMAVPIIQKQQKRIEDLEERLKRLEQLMGGGKD